MALTILFDVQVGFMGMTAIAILIGIMIGQNIDFINLESGYFSP